MESTTAVDLESSRLAPPEIGPAELAMAAVAANKPHLAPA
jgi:hypothetical protein